MGSRVSAIRYRSSYKGGMTKELLQDPMRAMEEIAALRAPIVKGRAGLTPIWFVVDPDLARQVLQTDSSIFRRNPFVNSLFKVASGENLFTTSGPAWKWRRGAISPSFRAETLHRDLPTLIDAVSKELNGWPSRESCDAQKLAMDLALNVALKGLFSSGLDENSAHDLRAALGGVVAWITYRLGHPYAGPTQLPTTINRELRNGRTQAQQIVQDLIDRRRNNPGQHVDLLSQLMAAVDPDTGRRLSDDQLVNESLVLLFAGHETTASAAAWAMELLARHPKIQDRARAEVDQVLRGETLQPVHLNQLRYIRAVIDETMRLYPPAWGIPRMPFKNVKMGGVKIRRFTPTIVAIAAMHRSPTYWNNPNEFDPNRFLTKRIRTADAYQPFGTGPRQCIGARFATNELTATIATLIASHSIVPATDKPATPHAVFGLRANHSILRLEPRTSR